MNAYGYLVIAILAEVIATTALKAAQSFTQPLPSFVVVAGYAVAFYCLSMCLQSIPVGVVYAIWSGLGIVLVTLLGWWVYGQSLDAQGFLGMGLILAGVIVLNLFSQTAPP
ncbi:multidrug transporter [Neosynechococcus sphagnicola sy1]|uniref:Multidrug transporter n=1 Tax=Neosynechococcus sphagnicola sy1 TaxID=1497020 RepID=A0A098TJI0_9CYAN|nr:multidrug efflux SMR transporter [Neosynechococcus sphagnicola]KGF72316.1 multidrug transporter [Neosynechococcus sphagnicola sy1]